MINNSNNESSESPFNIISHYIEQDKINYTCNIRNSESIAQTNNAQDSESLARKNNEHQVREIVTRCRENDRRGHKTRNLYAVGAYNRRSNDRRSEL